MTQQSTSGFFRGFQHFLHHFEINFLRLRIADAALAQTDAFYFQHVFVNFHHIGSNAKRVEADEMLLAGSSLSLVS